MHDLQSILLSIQPYGLPGLIFLGWAYSQWQKDRQMNKIIEKNFELLEGLLESMQYQGSVLARIDEKIGSNQYCPAMRREFRVVNFGNNTENDAKGAK